MRCCASPLGIAAKPLLPKKYRNPMLFYYGPDGRVYRRQIPLETEPEKEKKEDEAAGAPVRQRLPVEFYIAPQAYGMAGSAEGTRGCYEANGRNAVLLVKPLNLKE